jgi:hypothetical protein
MALPSIIEIGVARRVWRPQCGALSKDFHQASFFMPVDIKRSLC